MKKISYSALLLILFLTVSRSVHAQTYTWNQVRIGGSGALPSFVAHPKVPDLYFITTDVGTPYRWNKDLQKWEHLMLFEKIPVNYWNWEFNQRCGSIGVDPNDATGNILYATVQNGPGSGPGRGNGQMGTILKSTNRGDTWTDLQVPINVQPNSTQVFGDRIQVDPSNSNHVWVVTDSQGALKSENAGTSWTQVSNITTPGYCSFILFDQSSGTVSVNGQSVTKRIYIGRSTGVFASEDGGLTFALMSNSPAHPYRATIHTDGTLYVSAGAENLPKGVYKYKNGGWQNISPVTLEPDPDPNKPDRFFSKVAVSPFNSNYIVVGTRGTWQKDPYFVSKQGGAPGSYSPGQISRDNTEAPHSKNDGLPFNAPGHNPIAYTWDPFYPNKVWINDLLDVLSTDDVFAAPTTNWKIRVVGLEEIMVTGPLVAPPSGKNQLFSATADVGGAHHRSLTEPLNQGAVNSTALFTSIFSAFNMTGVAFQYTDPEFVVRVGCDGPATTDLSASRAGYSTNGGDSYTLFPKSPGVRGRIAVSANRRNILWLTQMDGNNPGNLYWSEDLGASWTKSTGVSPGILPAGPQWMLYPGQNHLAADKVNGDYFYIWDRGSFYVSSDGGKSFVKRDAEGLQANAGNNPSTGSAYATTSNIEVTPGKTGDVWIAYHNEAYPQFSALYHTTDTGRTFVKVGGESFKPKWVAAAMSDTTANAHLVLYVTSQAIPINGINYGAFRSDDTGRTWTTILDRLPGVAPNITADNKGRMFISAHGNGIFFGSPVAGPVQSVEIINPASDTLVKGYTNKLNVKLTPTYPTNPAVTWTSSDTTVAKVDQFGKVSGINAGNATITVTSVDGGKTDTHPIVVIPPTISTGITIDSVVYSTMNTPRQLSFSVLPANTTNKTLTWTIADSTVANVDANGVITGLKLDTTTLTITAADGGFSKTVQLVVNNIVTAINAGTTGNPATPYQHTNIGQYVPEGAGGTGGLWHAGYTGSSRITATVDLSQVTEPAPRQVYEYMRISRNNVTPMRYYLRNLISNANYSVRLHFIEPSDADKNNRIFSVKASNGDSLINFNVYQAAGNKLNTVVTRTLQAKSNSAGVIEIWFYPKTGDLYSASISALEARIISLQGINIQSDSSNLYVSYTDTLKLTTTPLNATNRNVSYLSSNPAIATVDLNGVVTGKSAGTVTITATSAESGFTATKTYNVIYVPVQSLTLSASSATVFVGLTHQLTTTITPANASNKQVVWTSSDTLLAKVSGNGTITGVKEGDVIIKAASAENPAIFAQANVHVTNVLATGLTLHPSTAIIGAGDTLLMGYTFSPANTTIKKVTWSSSDATIATVDTAGIITAIKQGTATITANSQDGSGVSATLPVTVVPFDSCGGIPNYGFESDLINWITFKSDQPFAGAVYTVAGKGHSGDKAVTMGFTTVKTGMNIQGSIPVRGGSIIVFTKWVKVEKDANGYPWWSGYGVGFIDSLGAPAGNANYQKVLSTVAAYRDNWAQVRDTITVPDNATGLTYWVAKEGFGTVWLDDYCIEVLKTNKSALYGINAGTTQNPPGPYANTTFAQYVPEGPTGTDKLWHAGYTWVMKVNAPVDLSYVEDPAPPQVYEYVRVFKSNITQMRYYLRGLTPDSIYAIRMHFVEHQDTEKNKRIFTIKATNGLDSLTDFNIYQAAGNKLNTAVTRTIRARANSAGLITVTFYPKTGMYDPYSGSIAGIEVRSIPPAESQQNLVGGQSRIAQPGIVKANDSDALVFATEVYPNPSATGFNVRMLSPSKAPAVLIIVDNAGTVIHSEKINNGERYQVGQNLKAGVYYINIRQGHQNKTMKVVKQ